jgi:proton glutamate symport protein
MKWYRQLHWQIITGLILGLIYGVVAATVGWVDFTEKWISPFGNVFISLLKLIGIPLVIFSLVSGIASLSDMKTLSRMGGKTIALYIGTTVISVTIGLIVVNVLNPGDRVPDEIKTQLQESYAENASARQTAASDAKGRGPLQWMVDIVPDNFFGSASNNRNMLQVVFISVFVGIALVRVSKELASPVIKLFDGLTAMVISAVQIIMLMAPIGVFALMADVITSLSTASDGGILKLVQALGFYCLTVVIGLLIHTFLVYPTLIKLFTPLSFKQFFKGIGPAQLLAFSTSSSGATLPVTMEQSKKELGVSEEVSSFVLPLGATINMDGTALYQAVAAVFIGVATGYAPDLTAQITIVLTAVLASIGTAAVPGAGIIMLVIILEAINVPTEGIALILGVDRILDMIRTACNVTGDAAVAAVIASSENQLNPPKA